MEKMRKRNAVLESEIRNFSRAVASGPVGVPSLGAAILKRGQGYPNSPQRR
jgi:hypothetical protein